MIDVQTLDRLKAMRLSGMAEYFENLAAVTGAQPPTGPEMVKMAVDWEYERRRNSKLHRLRRHAALAQPAADIADIKAMPGRNVDAELIAHEMAKVGPHCARCSLESSVEEIVDAGEWLLHHAAGDLTQEEIAIVDLCRSWLAAEAISRCLDEAESDG